MRLIADRPSPGPVRPYRFPEVVRQGGVVAAHLPGQELAVAALLLDAGAAREPAGSEGAATVVAEALREGTTTRDTTAFALALERLGTKLYTAVDWDAHRTVVQVPVDHLPDAVTLVVEATRSPRLDPADVIRVRDDEATARRMAWSRPGPRADAALRADLFGGARHALPLRGTPDTVAALSVDHIVAHHRRWFAAPGTLLVAGDLARVDLDALGAMAGVRAGAPLAGAGGPLPFTPRGARRIVVVDRPGAVQSILRLGHAAPHRLHPDHVPMTLAATVLGGAFTSRLNHLIREVRGYTYGIRSEFGQSRRFGRFLVSAGVQTEVTAPAIVDTVAEIERTQAGGVTAEELGVASAWRAGQLLVDLQTPAAIAGALATLVVHDLPDDYHPTLRTDLLAADLDTVSAAAARHLRPGDLTLVVEGDAGVIRGPLADTGLGEVVDA